MKIPEPDDVAVFALDAIDDEDDVHAVERDALDYADAVSALAEAVASPPVLGLRGHVLAAAFAARAPGASIDDGGADTAVEAFARTVADVDAVLAALDEQDWQERAHPSIGRVRDVVAHLLAIELYVLEQLLPGEGTAPVVTEHVEYARPTVDAMAAAPVDELRHRWRQAADALTAAVAVAPADTMLHLHGLPTGRDGAMAMRTFELWAHLDDICRATGRRRPRLDARRLRAMSTALVDALPIAAGMAGYDGLAGPVRLVLTGPGGGQYDVAFGAAGGPRATITVDVVDLCRLAARRAAVDTITVATDGDGPHAAAVLASAAAFALD
jgi:uncharacterized protein (TIGR03083 family)